MINYLHINQRLSRAESEVAIAQKACELLKHFTVDRSSLAQRPNNGHAAAERKSAQFI